MTARLSLSPPRRPRPRPRAGMALILVLVVISILSLAAYTFAVLMRAESEGATIHGLGLQSRAIADSGIALVQEMLIETAQELADGGGLYDNPARFQGLLVQDSDVPAQRGRVAIVAGRVTGGQWDGIRFGLENESTRLNLQLVLLADAQSENGGREMLMKLPGMTEDVADAILDWLDSDDEPREFGAEIDYYATLVPPYAPANGNLNSVEELLLVRGVTPELLFGPDRNRNHLADADEPGLETVAGIDNSDGSLDQGWASYLTLYSAEANLRPDGTPRIQLGGSDMEQLHADLSEVFPEEWATFIVAFLQNGPYEGEPTTPPQTAGGRQLDLSQPANTQLTTVLDLIGPPVEVTFEGDPEPTILENPFPDQHIAMAIYLPTLMDHVTVNPAEVIPGRININQAPHTILMGIPGVDAELVDQILSNREEEPSPDDIGRNHETWLLTEGLVTLEEMKAMMPYVTAGGRVFRAQSVGYFEGPGPATRIEFVVDATSAQPGLIFYRDHSHLGRGYPVEMLGIEAAP